MVDENYDENYLSTKLRPVCKIWKFLNKFSSFNIHFGVESNQDSRDRDTTEERRASMEREMRRKGEICRERWKPKLLVSLIDEGFV